MFTILSSISLHEKAAIAYRGLGIFLLYLLWVKTDRGLAGLFLLLALLTLMLLRWRFPRLKWTLVIDQLVVIGVYFLWENSSYALALGVFEAAYFGCPFLMLPAVFFAAIYRPEVLLILLLIQSAFAGIALWGWCRQQEAAFRRMDEERRRYYETEGLKEELLMANVQVARMAELSERSRIAREIHDNAGHEIVAAYMSFQTVEALPDSHTVEAQELFHEGMERLEAGIDKIREAVHNLTPLAQIGVDVLRERCEKFPYCPVAFAVYGDSTKVSVYLWTILEACLKEALTNILRHADAVEIRVTLDITPHIVRLCVENDGVKKEMGQGGLGLRNLQQRAAAVGGNISTDLSDCFRLVCVLPLEEKGGLT